MNTWIRLKFAFSERRGHRGLPVVVAPGFRVGMWVVSPGEMTISRGSESVHLEPKVMDVLVKLSSRPGEVVTRDVVPLR